MKTATSVILALLMLLSTAPMMPPTEDDRIIYRIVDPRTDRIQLLSQGDDGAPIGSIARCKEHVERNGNMLKFAMNGGMYHEDRSSVGLLIEDGKIITPLNKKDATGNFYLKPNGVFFIKKNGTAHVRQTDDLPALSEMTYATQSGPMLVIDEKIHAAFKEGSKNTLIRNGVGILSDGRVLFAISKEEINLFDFARFFRDKGCKNALYLDGFVSRAYIPDRNWVQTDGNFGVIIAVVK